MKKIALILSLVLVMSALAACTTKPEETTPETTLPLETTPVETTLPVEDTLPEETLPALSETETLIGKVYENTPVELPLMTMAVDLSDEFAVSAYTGAASAEGIVEAAFSESMIGAQPYSLTVVKCADAAAMAQTMFDNIDTRKWVCVEADTKMAASAGEYAFFVMIGADLAADMGVDAQALVDAFAAAVGTEVTVIK